MVYTRPSPHTGCYMQAPPHSSATSSFGKLGCRYGSRYSYGSPSSIGIGPGTGGQGAGSKHGNSATCVIRGRRQLTTSLRPAHSPERFGTTPCMPSADSSLKQLQRQYAGGEECAPSSTVSNVQAWIPYLFSSLGKFGKNAMRVGGKHQRFTTAHQG